MGHYCARNGVEVMGYLVATKVVTTNVPGSAVAFDPPAPPGEHRRLTAPMAHGGMISDLVLKIGDRSRTGRPRTTRVLMPSATISTRARAI